MGVVLTIIRVLNQKRRQNLLGFLSLSKENPGFPCDTVILKFDQTLYSKLPHVSFFASILSIMDCLGDAKDFV